MDEITPTTGDIGFVLAVVLLAVTVVFYLVYSNQALGWILTKCLSRFFLSDTVFISVRALAFSPLSGRLMFKDLRYFSRNSSLVVTDGFVAFHWWGRHCSTSKQGTKVKVHLNGVEWTLYNNVAKYEDIASCFDKRGLDADGQVRFQGLWEDPSTTRTHPSSGEPPDAIDEEGKIKLSWKGKLYKNFMEFLGAVVFDIREGTMALGTPDARVPFFFNITFKRMSGCHVLDQAFCLPADQYRIAVDMAFTGVTARLVKYKAQGASELRRRTVASGTRRKSEVPEELSTQPEYEEGEASVSTDTRTDPRRRGYTEQGVRGLKKIAQAGKDFAAGMKFAFYGDADPTQGMATEAAVLRRYLQQSEPEQLTQVFGVIISPAQSAAVRVLFYQDMPGVELKAHEKKTVDDLPKLGLLVDILSGELCYGPFVDLMRQRIQKAFLPWDFRTWGVYRPRNGDWRTFGGYEQIVTFSCDCTVRVPWRQKTEELNPPRGVEFSGRTHEIKIHVAKGSRYVYKYPYPQFNPQGGTLTETFFDLRKCRVETSMNNAVILAAETVEVHMDYWYPPRFVFNSTHKCDFIVKIRDATAWYLSDHATYFSDFAVDWSYPWTTYLGEPFRDGWSGSLEFLTKEYAPYINRVEVLLEAVDVNLNANHSNVIFSHSNTRENTIVTVRVSEAFVEYVSPFDVFTVAQENTFNNTFDVRVSQAELLLSLPPSHEAAAKCAPVQADAGEKCVCECFATVDSLRVHGTARQMWPDTNEAQGREGWVPKRDAPSGWSNSLPRKPKVDPVLDVVDLIDIAVSADKVTASLQGWHLRHLANIAGNYGGSTCSFIEPADFVRFACQGAPEGRNVRSEFYAYLTSKVPAWKHAEVSCSVGVTACQLYFPLSPHSLHVFEAEAMQRNEAPVPFHLQRAAPPVATIPQGDVVLVCGVADQWAYCKWGKAVGWVNRRWLTPAGVRCGGGLAYRPKKPDFGSAEGIGDFAELSFHELNVETFACRNLSDVGVTLSPVTLRAPVAVTADKRSHNAEYYAGLDGFTLNTSSLIGPAPDRQCYSQKLRVDVGAVTGHLLISQVVLLQEIAQELQKHLAFKDAWLWGLITEARRQTDVPLSNGYDQPIGGANAVIGGFGDRRFSKEIRGAPTLDSVLGQAEQWCNEQQAAAFKSWLEANEAKQAEAAEKAYVSRNVRLNRVDVNLKLDLGYITATLHKGLTLADTTLRDGNTSLRRFIVVPEFSVRLLNAKAGNLLREMEGDHIEVGYVRGAFCVRYTAAGRSATEAEGSMQRAFLQKFDISRFGLRGVLEMDSHVAAPGDAGRGSYRRQGSGGRRARNGGPAANGGKLPSISTPKQRATTFGILRKPTTPVSASLGAGPREPLKAPPDEEPDPTPSFNISPTTEMMQPDEEVANLCTEGSGEGTSIPPLNLPGNDSEEGGTADLLTMGVSPIQRPAVLRESSVHSAFSPQSAGGESPPVNPLGRSGGFRSFSPVIGASFTNLHTCLSELSIDDGEMSLEDNDADDDDSTTGLTRPKPRRASQSSSLGRSGVGRLLSADSDTFSVSRVSSDGNLARRGRPKKWQSVESLRRCDTAGSAFNVPKWQSTPKASGHGLPLGPPGNGLRGRVWNADETDSDSPEEDIGLSFNGRTNDFTFTVRDAPVEEEEDGGRPLSEYAQCLRSAKLHVFRGAPKNSALLYGRGHLYGSSVFSHAPHPKVYFEDRGRQTSENTHFKPHPPAGSDPESAKLLMSSSQPFDTNENKRESTATYHTHLTLLQPLQSLITQRAACLVIHGTALHSVWKKDIMTRHGIKAGRSAEKPDDNAYATPPKKHKKKQGGRFAFKKAAKEAVFRTENIFSMQLSEISIAVVLGLPKEEGGDRGSAHTLRCVVQGVQVCQSVRSAGMYTLTTGRQPSTTRCLTIGAVALALQGKRSSLPGASQRGMQVPDELPAPLREALVQNDMTIHALAYILPSYHQHCILVRSKSETSPASPQSTHKATIQVSNVAVDMTVEALALRDAIGQTQWLTFLWRESKREETLDCIKSPTFLPEDSPLAETDQFSFVIVDQNSLGLPLQANTPLSRIDRMRYSVRRMLFGATQSLASALRPEPPSLALESVPRSRPEDSDESDTPSGFSAPESAVFVDLPPGDLAPDMPNTPATMHTVTPRHTGQPNPTAPDMEVCRLDDTESNISGWHARKGNDSGDVETAPHTPRPGDKWEGNDGGMGCAKGPKHESGGKAPSTLAWLSSCVAAHVTLEVHRVSFSMSKPAHQRRHGAADAGENVPPLVLVVKEVDLRLLGNERSTRVANTEAPPKNTVLVPITLMIQVSSVSAEVNSAVTALQRAFAKTDRLSSPLADLTPRKDADEAPPSQYVPWVFASVLARHAALSVVHDLHNYASVSVSNTMATFTNRARGTPGQVQAGSMQHPPSGSAAPVRPSFGASPDAGGSPGASVPRQNNPLALPVVLQNSSFPTNPGGGGGGSVSIEVPRRPSLSESTAIGGDPAAYSGSANRGPPPGHRSRPSDEDRWGAPAGVGTPDFSPTPRGSHATAAAGPRKRSTLFGDNGVFSPRWVAHFAICPKAAGQVGGGRAGSTYSRASATMAYHCKPPVGSKRDPSVAAEVFVVGVRSVQLSVILPRATDLRQATVAHLGVDGTSVKVTSHEWVHTPHCLREWQKLVLQWQPLPADAADVASPSMGSPRAAPGRAEFRASGASLPQGVAASPKLRGYNVSLTVDLARTEIHFPLTAAARFKYVAKRFVASHIDTGIDTVTRAQLHTSLMLTDDKKETMLPAVRVTYVKGQKQTIDMQIDRFEAVLRRDIVKIWIQVYSVVAPEMMKWAETKAREEASTFSYVGIDPNPPSETSISRGLVTWAGLKISLIGDTSELCFSSAMGAVKFSADDPLTQFSFCATPVGPPKKRSITDPLSPDEDTMPSFASCPDPSSPQVPSGQTRWYARIPRMGLALHDAWELSERLRAGEDGCHHPETRRATISKKREHLAHSEAEDGEGPLPAGGERATAGYKWGAVTFSVYAGNCDIEKLARHDDRRAVVRPHPGHKKSTSGERQVDAQSAVLSHSANNVPLLTIDPPNEKDRRTDKIDVILSNATAFLRAGCVEQAGDLLESFFAAISEFQEHIERDRRRLAQGDVVRRMKQEGRLFLRKRVAAAEKLRDPAAFLTATIGSFKVRNTSLMIPFGGKAYWTARLVAAHGLDALQDFAGEDVHTGHRSNTSQPEAYCLNELWRHPSGRFIPSQALQVHLGEALIAALVEDDEAKTDLSDAVGGRRDAPKKAAFTCRAKEASVYFSDGIPLPGLWLRERGSRVDPRGRWVREFGAQFSYILGGRGFLVPAGRELAVHAPPRTKFFVREITIRGRARVTSGSLSSLVITGHVSGPDVRIAPNVSACVSDLLADFEQPPQLSFRTKQEDQRPRPQPEECAESPAKLLLDAQLTINIEAGAIAVHSDEAVPANFQAHSSLPPSARRHSGKEEVLTTVVFRLPTPSVDVRGTLKRSACEGDDPSSITQNVVACCTLNLPPPPDKIEIHPTAVYFANELALWQRSWMQRKGRWKNDIDAHIDGLHHGLRDGLLACQTPRCRIPSIGMVAHAKPDPMHADYPPIVHFNQIPLLDLVVPVPRSLVSSFACPPNCKVHHATPCLRCGEDFASHKDHACPWGGTCGLWPQTSPKIEPPTPSTKGVRPLSSTALDEAEPHSWHSAYPKSIHLRTAFEPYRTTSLKIPRGITACEAIRQGKAALQIAPCWSTVVRDAEKRPVHLVHDEVVDGELYIVELTGGQVFISVRIRPFVVAATTSPISDCQAVVEVGTVDFSVVRNPRGRGESCTFLISTQPLLASGCSFRACIKDRLHECLSVNVMSFTIAYIPSLTKRMYLHVAGGGGAEYHQALRFTARIGHLRSFFVVYKFWKRRSDEAMAELMKIADGGNSTGGGPVDLAAVPQDVEGNGIASSVPSPTKHEVSSVFICRIDSVHFDVDNFRLSHTDSSNDKFQIVAEDAYFILADRVSTFVNAGPTLAASPRRSPALSAMTPPSSEVSSRAAGSTGFKPARGRFGRVARSAKSLMDIRSVEVGVRLLSFESHGRVSAPAATNKTSDYIIGKAKKLVNVHKLPGFEDEAASTPMHVVTLVIPPLEVELREMYKPLCRLRLFNAKDRQKAAGAIVVKDIYRPLAQASGNSPLFGYQVDVGVVLESVDFDLRPLIFPKIEQITQELRRTRVLQEAEADRSLKGDKAKRVQQQQQQQQRHLRVSAHPHSPQQKAVGEQHAEESADEAREVTPRGMLSLKVGEIIVSLGHGSQPGTIQFKAKQGRLEMAQTLQRVDQQLLYDLLDTCACAEAAAAASSKEAQPAKDKIVKCPSGYRQALDYELLTLGTTVGRVDRIIKDLVITSWKVSLTNGDSRTPMLKGDKDSSFSMQTNQFLGSPVVEYSFWSSFQQAVTVGKTQEFIQLREWIEGFLKEAQPLPQNGNVPPNPTIVTQRPAPPAEKRRFVATENGFVFQPVLQVVGESTLSIAAIFGPLGIEESSIPASLHMYLGDCLEAVITAAYRGLAPPHIIRTNENLVGDFSASHDHVVKARRSAHDRYAQEALDRRGSI